jgi:hypothetical protein
MRAVNLIPVDVLAAPTPPTPRALRWLPYAMGLLVVGLLGLVGITYAAVLVTPDPTMDAASSIMELASFGVIGTLTVVVPGGALLTLAIITRVRRSRTIYWVLVGLLATYILCGVSVSIGTSMLAAAAGLPTDAPADATNAPPDPIWLGIVSTVALGFVVLGFIASVVLLALPATRRTLR